MSSLDVVIVSYRCRELLRRCLTSLAANAPAGTSVRVVDNDSRDGTVELLDKDFPDVHLIANDRNLGFARATNLGLAASDTPYVLVLNPDTEIAPGSLEALLELMEAEPSVGIAGCRLEQPDGTFDHASRRSFPTLLGAGAHLSGLGRGSSGRRIAQYRAENVERGPVDAVNGAFMLIRREALEAVGAFDESYWMYMEDMDLCYRFREAGWITWYEPSVTATHLKGGTGSRARSPRLTLAFYAGMWRFVRAHPGAVPRPALRPAALAGIGLFGAAAVTRAAIRKGCHA